MDNNHHENGRPKARSENKKIPLFGALLLVLLAAGYFINRSDNTAKAKKATLDLFVMSQCPYGIQAEEAVFKARDGFENEVDFNVEYIADKKADSSFDSLHGQPEVEGDLYQLCVKKHYPDKFWDYLECQNQNYQDLKSSFQSCAEKTKADFEKIKTCAEGAEGAALLTASLNKAKEKQVSGSPTFFINGEPYNGARSSGALQRALCGAAEDKLKKCKNLPQDKEFKASVVTDARCTGAECQTDGLIQQLRNSFSKIQLETIDYATEKGQELFNNYELQYLPAVLFAPEVKESENFAQIERYVYEIKDLIGLRIGATHDPKKEICYNDVDDTGNGQIDCADADCAGYIGCREEKPKRLDLFVMSQCPYGIQAINAMEEVLNNFGKNIDFHLNYIASENPDGSFDSLHGQGEVDENIRELCAAKYYPSNYINYVWCRNKNIQADWQACAQDFPAIRACAAGEEGQTLLSNNIKLGNELGISASPTWLVNNRYIFNGLDAETVRTNFCAKNEAAGCENTLSGASAGSGTAGGVCN